MLQCYALVRLTPLLHDASYILSWMTGGTNTRQVLQFMQGMLGCSLWCTITLFDEILASTELYHIQAPVSSVWLCCVCGSVFQWHHRRRCMQSRGKSWRTETFVHNDTRLPRSVPATWHRYEHQWLLFFCNLVYTVNPEMFAAIKVCEFKFKTMFAPEKVAFLTHQYNAKCLWYCPNF